MWAHEWFCATHKDTPVHNEQSCVDSLTQRTQKLEMWCLSFPYTPLGVYAQYWESVKNFPILICWIT